VRKVTRSESAAVASLIKAAPECEPRRKVGNYRARRAGTDNIVCGIDTSIDLLPPPSVIAERDALESKVNRINSQRGHFNRVRGVRQVYRLLTAGPSC